MAENKGLMTREELALQFKNDASQQASQTSIVDKRLVYLVQSTTEEFKESKCKLGDFYIRANEHNFGQKFAAVVIGFDCFYQMWEGPPGHGRIVWSLLEEMLPHAPAHIRAACQWSGPEGAQQPPKAKKTWQFALMHVARDEKGVAVLDPHNLGIFYACLSVTAEKQGKELVKILDRQAKRENNPCYRLVIAFNSFEETNDKKQTYKNWEARVGAVLNLQEHFEILAVTAKEFQIYQQARAASVAKGVSVLSSGKQEAIAVDRAVDEEAEREWVEREADKASGANVKAAPVDDVPF